MTMSPIRNVNLLKVALLAVALFAALLTMRIGTPIYSRIRPVVAVDRRRFP